MSNRRRTYGSSGILGPRYQFITSYNDRYTGAEISIFDTETDKLLVNKTYLGSNQLYDYSVKFFMDLEIMYL